MQAPFESQSIVGRNGKPIVEQCVHGHPFDAANTRLRKNGTRACIACLKARRQASTPPPEPIDLPQDRAPYVDPDGAIMLVAAMFRQAIVDWLLLPHHTRHWKTARECLAGARLLTEAGELDTRGYVFVRATRRYTGRGKA